MPKFRKKPVEIEAIQFTGKNGVEVWGWAKERSAFPVSEEVKASGSVLVIKTLEGDMRADPNDWIICGVKKELYPCKPDIFAATYDAA